MHQGALRLCLREIDLLHGKSISLTQGMSGQKISIKNTKIAFNV